MSVHHPVSHFIVGSVRTYMKEFVGPVLYRKCTCCGESKPLELFPKLKVGKHSRNPHCKVCQSEYRKTKKEYNDSYKKKWYEMHGQRLKDKRRNERNSLTKEEKQAYLDYLKKYREENKDEISEVKKKHYRNNKEKTSARSKEWLKANPEKHLAYSATRRAAKLQRTPSWLTEKDSADIEDFYYLAKAMSQATGVKYVVDHIIPLQGKLVSGFHHLGNLQILTESENASKGNKYKIE